MPTPTPAYRLCVILACDEQWTTYDEWTSLIGFSTSPFKGDAKSCPFPELKRHFRQVQEFVKSFRAIATEKGRFDFFRRAKSDNHSDGRKAVRNFLETLLASKKVVKLVETHLKDTWDWTSVSILQRYQTIRADAESVSFPTLDVMRDYQDVTATSASCIFGPGCIDPGGMPLSPVLPFIQTIIARWWDKQRKTLARNQARLRVLRSEEDKMYKAIIHGETRLSGNALGTALTSYIAKVGQLINLLQVLPSRGSTEDIVKRQKELSTMLERMQSDGEYEGKKTTKSGQSLHPAIKKALKSLATTDEIKNVMHTIEEVVRETTDDPAELVDPYAAFAHEQVEWTTGVEHYQSISSRKLLKMLGCKTGQVPNFNAYLDQSKEHDPWDAEDASWFGEESADRVPLELRWHQLVGVVRMMDQFFLPADERAEEVVPSILLMDEVGLGKTLQVAAVVAFIIHFRDYYDKHGKFPGKYANHEWMHRPGNIPDEAFVIVVPSPLQDQWIAELHRFFAPKSIDIIPYVGNADREGRIVYWDEVEKKSEWSPGRRIILATTVAVGVDAVQYMNKAAGNDSGDAGVPGYKFSGQPRDGFITEKPFCVVFWDELHICRVKNRYYAGATRLRMNSDAFVGVTATPLLTKPSDTWNLGRILGIPGCSPEHDAQERALSAAIVSAQRAERLHSKNDQTVLRERAHGQMQESTEHEDRVSETVGAMVLVLREAFAGYVIRRDVNAVDDKGVLISGLKPWFEILFELKMTPWEQQLFEHLIDLEGQKAQQTQVGSHAFYLPFKMLLFHCYALPKLYTPSRQYSDIWRMVSSKLRALPQIVRHHLDNEDAYPVVPASYHWNSPDEGPNPNRVVALTEMPPPVSMQATGTPPPLPKQKGRALPDKIVVFSAFPRNFWIVEEIFKHEGIKYLKLDGTMTLSQRKAVIEEFRQSGLDGPRVLLMSPVGIVGLNLDCANILIMIDSCWSAQEDHQLIGRLWRWPQSKDVIVYRLIVLDTPDVFLNNLSFDKGAMLSQFVRMEENAKRLLETGEGQLDGDYDDEDLESVKSSRKGKERAAEPVTEETPSPTHQNLDDLSDLQASTSSTQRPRSTSVSDDDIPSPPPPRSARASQRADKSRSSIRVPSNASHRSTSRTESIPASEPQRSLSRHESDQQSDEEGRSAQSGMEARGRLTELIGRSLRSAPASDSSSSRLEARKNPPWSAETGWNADVAGSLEQTEAITEYRYLLDLNLPDYAARHERATAELFGVTDAEPPSPNPALDAAIEFALAPHRRQVKDAKEAQAREAEEDAFLRSIDSERAKKVVDAGHELWRRQQIADEARAAEKAKEDEEYATWMRRQLEAAEARDAQHIDQRSPPAVDVQTGDEMLSLISQVSRTAQEDYTNEYHRMFDDSIDPAALAGPSGLDPVSDGPDDSQVGDQRMDSPPPQPKVTKHVRSPKSAAVASASKRRKRNMIMPSRSLPAEEAAISEMQRKRRTKNRLAIGSASAGSSSQESAQR